MGPGVHRQEPVPQAKAVSKHLGQDRRGKTGVSKNTWVMERAYRNLGYFLLALLPIFIAGFWIPYLSEIPAFDASITPPVHIHAVLLFA